MTSEQESDDSRAWPPPEVSLDIPLRALAPGEWVHVEFQGKTVLGMIDRIQGGFCTFAYWEAGVLRFGTTTPDRIGARDEALTRQFRESMAIDPNYLAKFIASWARPGIPEASRGARVPKKSEPRHIQRFLFPE